jgi:hypothetical protein
MPAPARRASNVQLSLPCPVCSVSWKSHGSSSKRTEISGARSAELPPQPPAPRVPRITLGPALARGLAQLLPGTTQGNAGHEMLAVGVLKPRDFPTSCHLTVGLSEATPCSSQLPTQHSFNSILSLFPLPST